MKRFTIRNLMKTDIKFADELQIKEGWNYLPNDFLRLLNIEPSGFFIAEINKKKVGIVQAIPYEKTGWIGMLLVSDKYRNQGIGKMLLKHAILYLRNKGKITIRLESRNPIAIQLFKKLDFQKEFDIQIFSNHRFWPQQSMNYICPLKSKYFYKLIKFDSGYFGESRIKVIQELFKDRSTLSFIHNEMDDIIGYIMYRKTKTGYKIGPWVCNPSYREAPKLMIQSCLSRLGNKEVEIRIPSPNKTASKILKKMDFKLKSIGIRMYLGERKYIGEVNGIFAIGDGCKG